MFHRVKILLILLIVIFLTHNESNAKTYACEACMEIDQHCATLCTAINEEGNFQHVVLQGCDLSKIQEIFSYVVNHKIRKITFIHSFNNAHHNTFCEYQTYISIPVLKHATAHGEILTNDDIKYITIEEPRNLSNIVVNPEDLIGMVTTSNIKEDKAIMNHQVKKPFIIQRKQIVFATYRNGNLTLKLKVEAMEKGKRGDIIKVRNTNSNSILSARIEDANNVIIN